MGLKLSFAAEKALTDPAAIQPRQDGAESSANVQMPADENADKVIFTCLPVQTMQIANWHFAKGQLKLTQDEAAEFEAFLKTIDDRTRNQIRKIDFNLALEMLQAQFSNGPQASTQNDSSIGALPLRTILGTDQLVGE